MASISEGSVAIFFVGLAPPGSADTVSASDPTWRQVRDLAQRRVAAEHFTHRDQPGFALVDVSPVEELPAVVVGVVTHVQDGIPLEDPPDGDRCHVRSLIPRPRIVRIGGIDHSQPRRRKMTARTTRSAPISDTTSQNENGSFSPGTGTFIP